MERNEKIRKILDRAFAEDLSPEELNDLYDLLNKEDSEDSLKALLYCRWLATSSGRNVKSEEIFKGILQKTGIKNEDISNDESLLKEFYHPPVTLKRRMLSLLRYAAVIILAVISTFFITGKREKGILLADQKANSVTAPFGSRTYLELSDGTKVWLNSGSKIMYPGKFGNGSRSVSVEGEAYFEVAKDPGKPFIVKTSDIDIMVLGTTFNFKNYPDEKNIETTVIEGSVKVVNKKSYSELKEEIILKPKEKATYNKINNRITVDNITEVPEVHKPDAKITEKETFVAKEEVITAWKNEHLVFQRESLYAMARKLERWYGMTIIIDKRIPVNETYSGKFMNNETIYQVIEAINTITPLQAEVKGTTIYIRPGKK